MKPNWSLRILNAMRKDIVKLFDGLDEEDEYRRVYIAHYYYWRGTIAAEHYHYKFSKTQLAKLHELLDSLAQKKRKMFFLFGPEINVFRGVR